MKYPNGHSSPVRTVCRLAALLFLSPLIGSTPSPDVAIYARAYNGYTRTRLADNSLKPETYTFAEGGVYGGIAGDKSLENLSFKHVVKTIAVPLRKRGYIPSFDKSHTDFIILVFWGMTGSGANDNGGTSASFLADALRLKAIIASSKLGAAMTDGNPGQSAADELANSQLEQGLIMQSLANDQRDSSNMETAGILGYRKELEWAQTMSWFSFSKDIVSEVEEDRYFVVLKAYDFKERVEKRSWKIMWELRYSIPAHRVAFDKMLAEMTDRASKYFGQNIDHLIREDIKEGKVDIGTATVVEPAVK